NDIKVNDEELRRAIVDRARQFPGQEQQIWDYYRNNPGAVATLRAPIYEEKVVDFLLELAKVSEKTVPREELYNEDEEPAAPAAARGRMPRWREFVTVAPPRPYVDPDLRRRPGGPALPPRRSCP